MKNSKLMMPLIAATLLASTALMPVAAMGGVMNEGPIYNEALLKQAPWRTCRPKQSPWFINILSTSFNVIGELKIQGFF